MADIIDEMKDKFGNSDEESRQAVIDAHGGIDSQKECARLWADHHHLKKYPSEGELFVGYAVAVDLGVRIGRKLEANNAKAN